MEKTILTASLLTLLIKGLVIGIGVSAPVGPVATLCVRRSLVFGLRLGLFTGAGAVMADLIYAVLARLGSAVLASWVLEYGFWLRLVGGAVMLGMAWVTWRTPNASLVTEPEATSPRSAFLSAFLITALNPFTLVGFTAIFAAMGGAAMGEIPPRHAWLAHAISLGGILLGCVLWWGLLALGAHGLRRHIDGERLNLLRYGASSLLLIFGLFALVTGALRLNF
ncbi:MAG: LysE family transporter [Candidatus Symbiobacter sp.]|nr:LysE family transporter [Candidatus Symbiobacter sp.]